MNKKDAEILTRLSAIVSSVMAELNEKGIFSDADVAKIYAGANFLATMDSKTMIDALTNDEEAQS